MDENIRYIHMIFNKGAGLPEHFANAKNIYMIVIRELLSIGLDGQGIRECPAGAMLKIPFNTKMNVRNLNDDTLEFILVKAPSPEVK